MDRTLQVLNSPFSLLACSPSSDVTVLDIDFEGDLARTLLSVATLIGDLTGLLSAAAAI